MNSKLCVIIIEDSEFDAIIMAEVLEQGGYELDYERVETADELQEATHEMARNLADGPPIAIGISKMMVYQALETSLAVDSRLEFFGRMTS